MLIINADDWGRSVAETDAAFACYQNGRITSVSAMVFMEDSERAAQLAKENELDVGLHLNFSQPFTGKNHPADLDESHGRIVRYLTANKYAQLVYNPLLRKDFADSYNAQAGEFARLFGRPPSHVDGHHHMHLCANVLLSNIIPAGVKMRRNFSFWPGEKSWLNRSYRALVDRSLHRKYWLADYFFDLSQSIREKKIDRIVALAKHKKVEVMTHPILSLELAYLLGEEFEGVIRRVDIGGYALV